MKKKFIPLILALVCALCCTFWLAACGGDDVTTKVKDEAQWKQAIADARKSDNISFTAEFEKDNTAMEIIIEAAGNAQYLKMIMSDKETSSSKIWEYYYDGNYVYLNVSEQELGYTWQKIDASSVIEEFGEPLSYIDRIYSGEIARDMFGVDLTFDGLDELANRYADAQYGFNSEKYGADTYVIIDGDISANGIVYTLNFKLEYSYLRLEINSSGWRVGHSMGDTYYHYSVEVTIPTESVQEAE